jgi:sugar lactone lactonase YvrE
MKAASLVPLRPTALAVSPNGNLYIADQSRNQILARLPDGRFSVVAGTGIAGHAGDGGPAVDAQLQQPSGMAFAADGTLFFADQGNGRVRAISPSGTITTVMGDGQQQGRGGFIASGTPALAASPLNVYTVTIAPDGRLYVATGQQVLGVNPDGTLTVIVGGDNSCGGLCGLGGPAAKGSADGVDGLAFDHSGNLWLFGFNTKSVLVVTPSGTLTAPPGDQNIYPRGNAGLATAPDGSVIAMNEVSTVRLAPSGDTPIVSFYPVTFHGIRGFSPNGLAVGPDGTIYVDTYYGNGFADRTALASISPNGSTSQILWESTDEPVGTLLGNGISAARFGDSQSMVSAIFDQMFGQPTEKDALTNPGNCQINATTRWGEITAFFSRDRFVGYRVSGSTTPYAPNGGSSRGGVQHRAQTPLGLRVGDTLALAQNLYGSLLATSPAQGGTWSVTTPDGTLRGYLSGEVGQYTVYQLLIESIGAGNVGCPAASP